MDRPKEQKTTGFALSGALAGTPRAAGRRSSQEDAVGAPRVWLLSGMLGMEVCSPQGDSLGEIEDAVVHPGGEFGYAVLSFGGWLGIGEKLFAMPWSVLRRVERDFHHPGSERSLILPLDKEELKQAPGFDKDNWPAMASADWSRDVDTFYKARGERADARKSSDGDARATRIAWKISELRSCAVETPNGDELGDIKDLAIDLDGRVSYVALDLDANALKDERLVAVPWDSFEFSLGGSKGDEKRVTLGSARAGLDGAPPFMAGEEHSAEMCDPAWVAHVYQHFGVDPYWTDPSSRAGAGGFKTDR